MKINIFKYGTVVFLILFMVGCSSSRMPSAPKQYYSRPNVQEVNLANVTYQAVDALVQRTRHPLNKKLPVLVATVVDLNDFSQSSSLGRLIGEYASGRLVQQGYYIGEPRLRGTLAIQQQAGEMILSRDLAKISREYNAQAVVAGTYVKGGTKVHVNLKLIEAREGQILSSIDFSLPLGKDTKTLLETPTG